MGCGGHARSAGGGLVFPVTSWEAHNQKSANNQGGDRNDTDPGPCRGIGAIAASGALHLGFRPSDHAEKPEHYREGDEEQHKNEAHGAY